MSTSEHAEEWAAMEPPGEAGARRKSIIPPELTITGIIKCRGELEVFGLIDGDVDTAVLVVGESGKITGDVRADSVTINGHVVGNINCRSLEIESDGAVNGDVTSELLSVKQGAQFRGASAVTGNPRSCERDAGQGGELMEEAPFDR